MVNATSGVQDQVNAIRDMVKQQGAPPTAENWNRASLHLSQGGVGPVLFEQAMQRATNAPTPRQARQTAAQAPVADVNAPMQGYIPPESQSALARTETPGDPPVARPAPEGAPVPAPTPTPPPAPSQVVSAVPVVPTPEATPEDEKVAAALTPTPAATDTPVSPEPKRERTAADVAVPAAGLALLAAVLGGNKIRNMDPSAIRNAYNSVMSRVGSNGGEALRGAGGAAKPGADDAALAARMAGNAPVNTAPVPVGTTPMVADPPPPAFGQRGSPAGTSYGPAVPAPVLSEQAIADAVAAGRRHSVIDTKGGSRTFEQARDARRKAATGGRQ